MSLNLDEICWIEQSCNMLTQSGRCLTACCHSTSNLWSFTTYSKVSITIHISYTEVKLGRPCWTTEIVSKEMRCRWFVGCVVPPKRNSPVSNPKHCPPAAWQAALVWTHWEKADRQLAQEDPSPRGHWEPRKRQTTKIVTWSHQRRSKSQGATSETCTAQWQLENPHFIVKSNPFSMENTINLDDDDD